MIRHDNPGKGNNITLCVQVSEFTNQQACCGDIREQGMTTAGSPGPGYCACFSILSGISDETTWHTDLCNFRWDSHSRGLYHLTVVV